MAKHLTKLGLGRDEIPPQEPHPAADQTRRRRKQAILLVVLALLVAYLFALGRSYLAIQDGMMDVNQGYDALTAAARKADYPAAIKASKSLTAAMDKIQEQTQLWVWGIPARLPVVGDDVRMGRTLAAVGKHSCDDALMPVCDGLQKVVPADGSGIGSAKDLSKLLKKVGKAQKITKDCERQVRAAGDAHISSLNRTRDRLLSILSGTNDTYESLHDELTLLKGASDIVSIITS